MLSNAHAHLFNRHVRCDLTMYLSQSVLAVLPQLCMHMGSKEFITLRYSGHRTLFWVTSGQPGLYLSYGKDNCFTISN